MPQRESYFANLVIGNDIILESDHDQFQVGKYLILGLNLTHQHHTKIFYDGNPVNFIRNISFELDPRKDFYKLRLEIAPVE